MTLDQKKLVDEFYPDRDNVSVYKDNDVIYECMLNQTDIRDNKNKYYLVQLLKDDKDDDYNVWIRYGRVGARGTKRCIKEGDNLKGAIATFCKQFRTKTGNKWDLESNKDTYKNFKFNEENYS